MLRALVVLVVVASGSIARAQAPGEPRPPGETPVIAPPRTAPEKDPAIAVTMSIGTPVVGMVLALGGASGGNWPLALFGVGAMYVGPSTGQWYAGRFGGIGLATRTVAAYAIVRGFGDLLDAEGPDCFDATDAECRRLEAAYDHEQRVAETYFWTGVGLWVGSTVFDVVMAHRATTAWNREHALAVTPGLVSASGGHAPGLTLSMTF
jgi:hypothetical protein